MLKQTEMLNHGQRQNYGSPEVAAVLAHAGYVVRASREDAMLARLEKGLAPSAAPLTS